MQTPERLRDIRALEYLLFGGVPAVPDPMYSRGDYYPHTAIRHTRYSSKILEDEENDMSATIMGSVEYDLETGNIVSYDRLPKNQDKK